MIGSAAQTDQSVPPHASHQQVCEFRGGERGEVKKTDRGRAWSSVRAKD